MSEHPLVDLILATQKKLEDLRAETTRAVTGKRVRLRSREYVEIGLEAGQVYTVASVTFDDSWGPRLKLAKVAGAPYLGDVEFVD